MSVPKIVFLDDKVSDSDINMATVGVSCLHSWLFLDWILIACFLILCSDFQAMLSFFAFAIQRFWQFFPHLVLLKSGS